ncbi:long-chain-fatty-acid--CoA ligase [Humibacter sp. BT305]|nr:long-chain-fatty-acid--CoA ligase [Humibacter sp. BT305]
MNDYESRPWLKSYPEALAPTIGDLTSASVGDLVDRASERYGDKPAFSNLGSTLSFRDVAALSDRFAAYLVGELGLAPGERIVLQMPNLLQYPIAIFGALKAGLVVVNANPLYSPGEMKKVFVDSGAVAVVVLENFADKLEKVLAETSLKHVILTSVGDMLPPVKRTVVNFAVKRIQRLVPKHGLTQVTRFTDAMKAGRRHEGVALPEVRLDDTALFQYTGGTTGGTKSAVITHRNLLSNQAQMLAPMSLVLDEGGETVLAALPLYHIFCFTVNCLTFFGYGLHNVLVTNPRDTKGLVKTLATDRPTVLILVSTLAQSLLDSGDFRQLTFSHVKLVVAGGMALRSSTAATWKGVTGTSLFEGYGLTEASPVVSVNPVWATPRVGTIGLPLPSTDIEIRDEQGSPVPLGETGEMAVRGPQVMQGYWKHPDDTAAVLQDGWLLTGDIATMSDDGFITIVDRKKDMIVVSGFNVYPSELEELAMSHPKVKDAGAFGVPDERSGETPVLFVVKEDPTLTEDELKAFLKSELAGYKRPHRIVFRDELPKSNVGKVLRKDLRALLEDEKA